MSTNDEIVYVIYRGYEIKKGNGQWDIYLNGKHVCGQPSEEFACKYIDGEKRKQAEGTKS